MASRSPPAIRSIRTSSGVDWVAVNGRLMDWLREAAVRFNGLLGAKSEARGARPLIPIIVPFSLIPLVAPKDSGDPSITRHHIPGRRPVMAITERRICYFVILSI